MKFKRGELQRSIDTRGLTQARFAKIAEVSPKTVWKACQGQRLSKNSWSLILLALTRMPPLEKVS